MCLPPHISRELLPDLLQAAIHSSAATSTAYRSLSPQEWQQLSLFAQRQGVMALVLDAALRLPEEQLPPPGICYRFMGILQKHQAAGKALKQTLQQTAADYAALGIPFVLVKGLSLAPYYPQPELRAHGDLDLFLYQRGDYERAADWLQQQGFRYFPDSNKIGHLAYLRGPFMVENHARLAFFPLSSYNQKLQKLLQEEQQRGWPLLEIEQQSYEVLSPAINLLYIFIHLFHHFSHDGIGLKHLCDFYLLHRAYAQDGLVMERLSRWLRDFRLLKAASCFAQLAVQYLQADPSCFPYMQQDKSRYVKHILADTLQGGNFGFYHRDFSKSSTLSRRFQRFAMLLRRCLLFGGLSPSHFYPIPFQALKHRISQDLSIHL